MEDKILASLERKIDEIAQKIDDLRNEESSIQYWISIYEAKPKENFLVLLFCKQTKFICVGRLNKAGKYCLASGQRLVGVTHWAHLPKIPKDE